jgi:nucleotide-binding universal stress UspA family protein
MMTTSTERPTPTIVAGVDDTPTSLVALRVAADEAALRKLPLRVIHVWHFASTWGVPLVWPEDKNPGTFVHERLAGHVSEVLDERAAAGAPSIEISIEVIEGETIPELRRAGSDAALLVLGEPTHHGPVSRLGSVSYACAAHPPCPVLIVPGAD